MKRKDFGHFILWETKIQLDLDDLNHVLSLNGVSKGF